MKRQPRNQRRAGVTVKLTERDEMLLKMLGRFRAARSSDLSAIVFRDIRRDTAAQRLRRLFDAGYLDVRVGDRAEENVYSLGPVGRRWNEECGRSCGRVPRDRGHHLAIVQSWVALAVAVHDMAGYSLELFRPEWELSKGRRHHLPVVPDAMVQLRCDDCRPGPGSIRLCLEVDRGTESRRTLAAKMSAYEQTRSSGVGLFGWTDYGLAFALWTSGSKRRTAISELLERQWNGWWLVWDLEEGPREALSNLPLAPEPPLSASPYRKGSADPVSNYNAKECGPIHRGH